MNIASLSARSFSYVLACLLLAGTALAQPQAFLENPAGPIQGGLEDCTDFADYQQPMDAGNFFTARTSDEETGFSVQEDFVDGAGAVMPLSGTVDGLRWWGINFDFVATFCTDDDDAGTPFDLTFFDGDATGPGAVVATVVGASPAIVDTGIPFGPTTIGEYSASFPEVDVTGATWVGIVRQTGVAGCNWLWVDENLVGSYDDQAFQAAIVTTDQTMCASAGEPFTPVVEVPSLGQVGLLVLLMSLLGAGIYRIRRRR